MKLTFGSVNREHGRSLEMSEAESLHGQEHVRRYRETNGAVGHIWRRGSKVLLLTTAGRTSGRPGTTPLIYENAGDDYVISRRLPDTDRARDPGGRDRAPVINASSA